MGDRILDRAADVAPPISAAGAQNAAATADTYGVFRIATSASSQRFNIPMKWVNRWWDITAIGLDIQILFGGPTVAVSLNEPSTVSNENITLVATTGITIAAGTTRSFYVPAQSGLTNFAFISTDTTGFVEIYPSSNPTPGTIKG